jgi:ribosomal protein S11
VLAGILALASILFFTQAAIAIWILVVSGGIFVRGARDRETPAAMSD